MKLAYKTELGECYHGEIEEALKNKTFMQYKGEVQLIFTSPPFPLNTKKKYGNKNGPDYVKWLTSITTALKDYLTDNGSLVIEIGNAWEPNKPAMSTLPLETLLSIKKNGGFELCQQFVWFNTAKLPSPAQWVNVERSRVKDSFTNIWWMSKSVSPHADNRKVLEAYSSSMEKLLKNQKYNSGMRPSQHNIGKDSFLTDHGGAIPSNVLVAANTASRSSYLDYCKENEMSPHPARMPRFVADFFIQFLTVKGDLVLDPFAGSNTSGESAEHLERKWLAVEADRNYVVGSQAKFPGSP
ncbi:MAG: DNA-methyltransferase [Pyrinomonadaceae bacterium]